MANKDGSSVFYLHDNGGVSWSPTGFAIAVFPTFYLTSTTSIISGTGTMDDPYIINN